MSEKRTFDVTMMNGLVLTFEAYDVSEAGGVLKIVGLDGDQAVFAPGAWKGVVWRGKAEMHDMPRPPIADHPWSEMPPQ